jgi:hypothetical protein
MVPGALEIVVMLAMLLSGSFGFPFGVPPEKEDPLLARVAPEECVFYTSWAGMADPDPTSGNRTEQLLAEPEVQQLIASLDQQFVQSLQMLALNAPDAKARMLADAGPKLLRTLLTRPTAIFLSDLKMGPAGPDIKGGMLVNLGEDVAGIKAILERLQSEFTANDGEVVAIGKSKFNRFQTGPRAPTITWGTHGEQLIVGVGDGVVEAILARAKTAPPKWLVELRERLPVARRSTVAYTNLRKLLRTFAPMAGPQLQGVVEAIGFENVTSLGTVTGLDESGFVKRTLLEIDGKPQGLLAALLSDPLTADDLRPIDGDTPLALAFRLDAGKLLDASLKAVGQIDRRTEDAIAEGLRQFGGGVGFNVRDDLLKALGNVWTLHAAPRDGGLLTGWTMTIQVKDRKRIGEIHDQFVDVARQAFGGQRSEPKIQSLKFAGHEIYYLTVPGPEFPFSPAWCLTDERLVVAMFPQTLKGFLTRPKNVKSLAEAPSVARLLADGDGPIAIAYYDSREIFRFAHPFFQIVFQMIANQIQRQGLPWDAAMLPSGNSIEKHLKPFSAAVRRTDSGVEFISRQTLPGGNAVTSAPLAVALLAPAIFQARKSSRQAVRRMHARNNLKQLGLSMHNYHDVHHGFPAAHNTGQNGKPLLSWRVHVLPFLNEHKLYTQFHLDEPWNSKHNKRLIARMPRIYRSLGSSADPGKTVYLGIGGEKGVFAPPKQKARNGQDNIGTRIRDITDGSSNTIMVVEASDVKAVIWTMPDDLEPDKKDPIQGLVGLRPGGFLALLCDGSVRFVPEPVNRKTLRALFTKNGGEVVSSTWWSDNGGAVAREIQYLK